MTEPASKRSLFGLLFGYWPWVKEVIEEGTDRWQERTTIGGYPAGEWRPQSARYVKYRITNRYTGSVTIRKDGVATRAFFIKVLFGAPSLCLKCFKLGNSPGCNLPSSRVAVSEKHVRE